jgi:hypothetical protein
MTYSDREFGIELLRQLDAGYEPLRLAQWADHLFLSGDCKYSSAVRESLIDLFTMQEGEEFVIPVEELRDRARQFIASG